MTTPPEHLPPENLPPASPPSGNRSPLARLEAGVLPPRPQRPDGLDLIRVRAGFELHFEVPYPTPMLFVVEPQNSGAQRVVDARRRISPALPLSATPTYRDPFDNVVWRVTAPAGTLKVSHDLIAEVAAHPDPTLPALPKTRVEDLPGEVLHYLLPSRYVDSDLVSAEAWRLFGDVTGGWAQVQAVCDHLQQTLAYGAGSTSATTAREAYQSGLAVCRDFAHTGVAFCRALNIPARYVCGYLPDINVPPDFRPMDFHAWFEAWLDGEWRTFDARHNFPRVGRLLIATGRDASDAAFNTAFGASTLIHMKVWADEVPHDYTLPPEDEGFPTSPTVIV